MVRFSFIALRKARALLLLRFLFIVRVRGTLFLRTSPCRLENGHFPLLLLEIQSMSLRSVRVLDETDLELCARWEKTSPLRPERCRESLGKSPWSVVFGTSLEAMFIEILQHFCRDLGLVKPKEINPSYFS